MGAKKEGPMADSFSRPSSARPSISRRSLLATAAGLITAATLPAQAAEWRNKQPGMSYRRLGRTGLMLSEVLSGGDPIRSDNYKHLAMALEMGLNYLDMAPAYNGGDTEIAYGKFLAESPGRRSNVFLTTKVSNLQGVRNQLYKEIFDTLPGEKQSSIRKRAEEMLRERDVTKPGYFYVYYPGQRDQIGPAYLANAMMQDYAHKVEGSARYREFIIKSVEGSLSRVKTDHFDLLMCPHGAVTAEELDIPEILETFRTLKQQGKVRFLGVTSHTDPASIVRKAAALGHYDAVMCAYNVINGGYLEHAIREATEKGVGLIAMKVAMSVATHHKQLQPVPQWRIDKLNRLIPGDLKPPLKAYTWALQNPKLTAVISNLWDETHVRENLSVAGKRVELQPA
jgi:aryl-alcohol dehydrogenase-like predicted oxidoreductase